MILSTFTVAFSLVGSPTIASTSPQPLIVASPSLPLIKSIFASPSTYIEDFDDSAGMTAVSGNWYYSGGAYALSESSAVNRVSYPTEIPQTTCDEISVKFKLTSSSSWQYAGLLSRYDLATNSGILVHVAQNTVDSYLPAYLSDYVNGSLVNLSEAHLSKISFGTWHELKLTVSGSTYTLYLDGTAALTYSSSNYSSGRAAIWSSRANPTYFDNLTVTGTPPSTALSISPSSFTLDSGGLTTLTATLTSGGAALTSKSITWSASTGTLSASSGTTNSSGQASVTYTAPSVTIQTSATITASFAGDSSYQASSGTSSGTIVQYLEDFDDAAGMTSVGGSWSYSSGAYTLSGEPGMNGASYSTEIPQTTCDSVGVKFKLTSGTAWQYAGVLSRYDPTTDSGMVGSVEQNSVDGYLTMDILEYVGENAGHYGNSTTSTTSKVSFGAWHELKLTASGSLYTLYLDGASILTFSSSRFSSGRAGVFSFRGSPTYFDNLTVFGSTPAVGPAATALSVSPSSFTISSGASRTLTATLTSSGSALSNKTVTWSVSSGTLSASSGTTNSSGQVSVTYTAPSVTTQTSVTITVSFTGDSSYQSSSGSSVGTVTVSLLPSTTLSVSPSSFTLTAGNATAVTATLTSSSGLLAGKTITWSTTAGSLSATSGTTNSSGQVSVTYTAPTVTAATAVTVTASFAGDSSYQSSSGISLGTVNPAVLYSTTISVFPSSFTIQSSGSMALTTTLTDAAGNSLTNKTITWSATSGTLSATSGTTVTYTAPSVTSQTPVTITASFAGDASYSSSQASSVGTASPSPQVSTSIIISPLVFDAKSGENVLLTILLTGEGGAPVAGKTVALRTTVGSIVPSSVTTDSSGMITATFTGPSVDVRTSFIITASFTGDEEYSPETTYSTGTVIPITLAETVERIENTMTRLEVSVESLASKIDSLTSAIAENRFGLGINIENGQSTTEYEHPLIDAAVEIRGTNIEVRVDSLVENGKTVLINIDNYTKTVLQLDHITVWIDNEEITQATDYDDVLDPTNDGGEAEYLILVGGNGVQVLVSIPHFSAHTITIGTMPTVPTAGIPSLYLVLGAALGLVVVTVAVVWHHLQKSRLETTSMLIEHGMKDMRIAEAEITREIRDMTEFTIPDLMQRTGASKTAVWRTVQKLMEKNLVQPTEQKMPPISGGGRGKPSAVYRYVGK